MQKIIINACFGGYGFSKAATKLYAEKKGLDIWVQPGRLRSLNSDTYWLVPEDQWVNQDNWHSMSDEEKKISNKNYRERTLDLTQLPRTDETLIEVVTELGKEASDSYSNLIVIEIPDDVEWQVEEYDGYEHIAEKHRTWP